MCVCVFVINYFCFIESICDYLKSRMVYLCKSFALKIFKSNKSTHTEVGEISATIYPNINFMGRVRNIGLEDYFRPPIESIRDKLSRSFRSHSKIVHFQSRWGVTETTERFLDTRGRCQASFTLLSSDRFQDRDTDNTDDRCRTTRTENRRWQCDGVEHRRLIYFVECNGRQSLWRRRRRGRSQRFLLENAYVKSQLFSNTTTDIVYLLESIN